MVFCGFEQLYCLRPQSGKLIVVNTPDTGLLLALLPGSATCTWGKLRVQHQGALPPPRVCRFAVNSPASFVSLGNCYR